MNRHRTRPAGAAATASQAAIAADARSNAAPRRTHATARVHVPRALALALAAALAGCAAGPAYRRPDAPTADAYKEAPRADAGWLPAAPADALERGPWWTLFGDAGLDALAPQVEVSNPNVAAAVAANAQANALVREQRAARFPSLGIDLTARRAGGAGAGSASGSGTSVQAAVGASWAPDLWGRLASGVAGARANADASAADLAAARLAAQGDLATDYFALRGADAEVALLRSAVDGYARALEITRNRYAAGISPRTDVLQAQTQLASTRADLAALEGQRARLEHAIAVRLGRPPAGFALPAAEWSRTVPAVPLGVPSELLQRRPDIAAAERAVAAANAQIGVERAAYFPSLTLTGSAGHAGSRVADLFGASTTLWSLGVSVAQTLFDAGATRARVAGAEAARDAAVARYRQTVLAAFQGVEDQLATLRALAEQVALREAASQAADQTEQQLLNRYKAAQVSYTEVVGAQAAALAARRTLAQLVASRQAATIALIEALGGGWHAPAG